MLKGLLQIFTGIALWVVAIIAELAWLGICFGSVIIGLILLILAPWILLAPLTIITIPGTSLIHLGLKNTSSGTLNIFKKRKIIPFNQMKIANLRLYADNGHIIAQHEMGLRYLEGCGVKKNAPQALVWFKRAADQGHIDAQHKVGVMFLKGYGTIQKPRVAIKFLHKAAENGHVHSQKDLAYLYQNGYGDDIKKDEYLATKWYEIVSKQGYEPANSRPE